MRLIETLASAQLPGTEAALANSLTRAGAVADALRAFRWDRLTPLREAEATADDRGRSAASALNALREAVRADEFASRISPALSAAEEALYEWLTAGREPEPVPGSAGPDPVPHAGPGQASPRAHPIQGHRDTGRRHVGLIRTRAADRIPPEPSGPERRRRVAGHGVTTVTASASTPVLRELLDEARAKNYEHGVLGVRAKPDWPPRRARSRTTRCRCGSSRACRRSPSARRCCPGAGTSG